MEHIKGGKFTEKNKVEEIQLANLARALQARKEDEARSILRSQYFGDRLSSHCPKPVAVSMQGCNTAFILDEKKFRHLLKAVQRSFLDKHDICT